MKYTIITISDERKENIEFIKNVMSRNELISSIEFVDGRKCNPFDILNHIGISRDVYAPDDGRTFPMTEAECGCWISHVRCIEFAVDNKLDKFLVFEDDAILDNNFMSTLMLSINDLPDGWDFLSLYSDASQNYLSIDSDIGSQVIHKCIAQLSWNQVMLYSYSGAIKLLRLFKRKGATYNIDSVIYRASRDGFVNGYILRPDCEPCVSHGKYISIIDPNNSRKI